MKLNEWLELKRGDVVEAQWSKHVATVVDISKLAKNHLVHLRRVDTGDEFASDQFKVYNLVEKAQ